MERQVFFFFFGTVLVVIASLSIDIILSTVDVTFSIMKIYRYAYQKSHVTFLWFSFYIYEFIQNHVVLQKDM